MWLAIEGKYWCKDCKHKCSPKCCDHWIGEYKGLEQQFNKLIVRELSVENFGSRISKVKSI